jgi:succinyl-CoA synthetase alpha subunit
MSRSGGMTTEIANTLSAAGLGQSTCVSSAATQSARPTPS